MKLNLPKYITSVSIIQDKIIDVYKGNHGNFYNIKGTEIYYDIHFPILWAIENISYENIELGPNKCENCQLNGYYNGVFIGYCVECACKYDFKRGNGIFARGVEVNEQIYNTIYPVEKKIYYENSIWNTYLKDISLEMIGDDYMEQFNVIKTDEYNIDNAINDGFIAICDKNKNDYMKIEMQWIINLLQYDKSLQ